MIPATTDTLAVDATTRKAEQDSSQLTARTEEILFASRLRSLGQQALAVSTRRPLFKDRAKRNGGSL